MDPTVAGMEHNYSSMPKVAGPACIAGRARTLEFGNSPAECCQCLSNDAGSRAEVPLFTVWMEILMVCCESYLLESMALYTVLAYLWALLCDH